MAHQSLPIVFLPPEALALRPAMSVIGSFCHRNTSAHPNIGITTGVFKLGAGVTKLNPSRRGIYIDTGWGSAANTVIPANSGIQGTVQKVLSGTPVYAGATKNFAPSGCAN